MDTGSLKALWSKAYHYSDSQKWLSNYSKLLDNDPKVGVIRYLADNTLHTGIISRHPSN